MDTERRLLIVEDYAPIRESLATGLRAVVPVPIAPVFPSPLGSYDLTFTLQSKPSSPGIWSQLACPSGLGQVLIDATIQAVPTGDKDVASRLLAARGALDGSGCRTGADKPDERLHALLAGTVAGMTLVPVVQDADALVKGLKLATTLQVYVANGRDTLATHTLTSATLFAASRLPAASVARTSGGSTARNRFSVRCPAGKSTVPRATILSPRYASSSCFSPILLKGPLRINFTTSE